MKTAIIFLFVAFIATSCNFVQYYEVRAEAHTYGSVYQRYQSNMSEEIAAHNHYGMLRDSMDELKYVVLLQVSNRGVDTIKAYVPGH